jgi:hypothetical protein
MPNTTCSLINNLEPIFNECLTKKVIFLIYRIQDLIFLDIVMCTFILTFFFVYSSLYNNLCIDDCISFYKITQRNILYKIYTNKKTSE